MVNDNDKNHSLLIINKAPYIASQGPDQRMPDTPDPTINS
jgi:hypothetical protein